jgi:hypothetical protein
MAWYRIGPLTESSRFAAIAPVRRDLRQFPPKTLSPIACALLANVPTVFEQRRAADVFEYRAAAIQRGSRVEPSCGEFTLAPNAV